MVKRFFGILESHLCKVERLQESYVTEKLDICQEECAELIKAISKYKRYRTLDDVAKITEEMSHVLVNCALVARFLGITQKSIDEECERKDQMINSSEELQNEQ